MTITTTLPSTTRRPGRFHEFDLASTARGLVPLDNRILLIGVMGSGTATADDFFEIFDELQSDTLFGVGSEITLMVRKVLEAANLLGFAPAIFATGIADPAGTAAQITLTVTAGSAAVNADIAFTIAGRKFLAGVTAGDDQDAVALALKTAIDGNLADLPITAAVVTNVCTLTANQTGVNGNDIKATIDDVGLTTLVITPVASTPGAGNALITTALSNSLPVYFETKAIANHLAGDITVLKTHMASAWLGDAKRWNFAFLAETGSLGTGTTLASGSNDERILVKVYEGSPQLPGEIAAMCALEVSARELPNFNWDGQTLPCALPPDSDVFTTTEIESALAAGASPLRPNDQRTTTEIIRMTTTKTLEGGNPFDRVADLAVMRGLVFTTRQVDVAFGNQFQAVNKSIQVIKRMRSVAYRVLKSLETFGTGVTQRVDELFPQLIVEPDETVATRANISLPESIIPNLHQIAFVHVLHID